MASFNGVLAPSRWSVFHLTRISPARCRTEDRCGTGTGFASAWPYRRTEGQSPAVASNMVLTFVSKYELRFQLFEARVLITPLTYPIPVALL